MLSEGTTKIAAGTASAMFAIFLATAVIHFAGWMQLHSTAVTGIMYGAGALAAGCGLFWIFALGKPPGTAVADMLEPPRDSQVNTNASVGNIHFAPVIQVGTSGSPSAPGSARSGIESSHMDASKADTKSSSSRASETSANMEQDLPDLDLSFAQGSALLDDSMLCFSEAGNRCITIRIRNKPAAKMSGALVARQIVTSISLKSGSRVASVESSCWIDHDANQIDLRPGAYAHALLVFLDRDALTMFENQNPISRKDLEWNSSFSEPERVPFPVGGIPVTFTGEVHVISRANHLKHTTLAHRDFIISLDDRGSGLPGINVKWVDSSAQSGIPIPTSRVSLPERPGPQVELLNVETRPIHLDESEIWRIGQMTDWRARALLLPFYLDPKRSSPGERVEYAMAHMVFVSEALAKTRIAHGCWINASLDSADIRPGETKYLILAIGSDGSSAPFLALSTNRTRVGWEEEAGDKPFEDFELSPGKYKVEITLLWGGNSEFRKTFEIPLTIS